jgi:anti-sigma B factor antagonist
VPDTRYLIRLSGGVPVVAVPVEVDVTTSAQLREILLEASGSGHSTVVVDMSQTRFCDSSGLHTLIRAHKRAVSEGGELRLVVPPDGTVPRILNLTGLDLYLPCFPSVAEALSGRPGPGPSTASSGGRPVTLHRETP